MENQFMDNMNPIGAPIPASNSDEMQTYLDNLASDRQREAGLQMMYNALAGRGSAPLSAKGIYTDTSKAELENYLGQLEAQRKLDIVNANKADKVNKFDKTKYIDPATGSAVSYDPTTGQFGYVSKDAGWKQVLDPIERPARGSGKGTTAASAVAGGPVAKTKGEKKKDETYAKKYVDWTERRENVISNVELLNQTIKELEAVAAEDKGEIEDSGFNTGYLPTRLQGRLPDIVQTEDMIRWRNSSDSIAMAKLRESLGSQFTEKEGQKLLSLAYDPALSAEENLKRLKESRKMLENKISQADEQAQYFEDYGTLKGYEQPRRKAASDLEKVFGSQEAETKPAPKLSAEDQEALDWAKANPDDPRAAQILKTLGM